MVFWLVWIEHICQNMFALCCQRNNLTFSQARKCDNDWRKQLHKVLFISVLLLVGLNRPTWSRNIQNKWYDLSTLVISQSSYSIHLCCPAPNLRSLNLLKEKKNYKKKRIQGNKKTTKWISHSSTREECVLRWKFVCFSVFLCLS